MSETPALPTVHCVMCTKPMPPGRRRDSITCSNECSKARYTFIRESRKAHLCDFCQRPASPEDKAAFKAFRRWQKSGLTEPQHASNLLKEVARLKKKMAESEGVQQ